MGCASSSPLSNTGKNFIDAAKDSANEVAAKGEQTLHGKFLYFFQPELETQKKARKIRYYAISAQLHNLIFIRWKNNKT